jgi:hypothetical protein
MKYYASDQIKEGRGASIGEMRNAYKILVGSLEGKRLL